MYSNNYFRFYFSYESANGETDFIVIAESYREAWEIAKMFYDTKSGGLVGFIHRTVQGGLFIKMLDASGKLKIKQ